MVDDAVDYIVCGVVSIGAGMDGWMDMGWR
jgi:hypothetical protein